MTGVSGVRGIYGDGLTDVVAERFARAFGIHFHGAVVIGRDSRKSGKALSNAVVRGLRQSGADVIDLGLTSTPTVEMAVTALNAAGGVIITASHNPAEWNGLKFLGPDGVFLTPEVGQTVLETYENGIPSGESHPPSRPPVEWEHANIHHVESVLSCELINRALISSKRYTVCLDTVNGAGGPICTDLLESLGCSIHIMYGEPTGAFSRGAEPVPENIRGLCALVKEKNSHIGFAVDPDVDRLSIVDERGNALGEEYTLALAVDYCMERLTKTAACNLSTSRMIDDVAARHGGRVYRSPVGEINVIQVMRETGAGIGGEGNGGVIVPALHYGRDAVMGMALILQYMAEKGETISSLAGKIPRYHMIKDWTKISGKGSWKQPLLEVFHEGESFDTRDGIKVTFGLSWVHVRESNTEPIIRIIAEAPSRNEADMLVERVKRVV